MLIIKVREGESIERALRRYKRKVANTKLIQDLRNRKEYVKPSVRRKKQKQNAIYRQKKKNSENE